MKSSPKQTDYPIYSEGKLSKRKQLFHLSLRNRLPALRQTPISESDTDSQNDERQALKRIVVFFAVMLILTLVARGTSSAIRPVVTTQQAKAGTISQSVQSSGSITASSVLSVSLPEGVVLDNILVKEGQSVVEGQTLATCDVDELSTKLDRAKASLQKSKAEYNQLLSNAVLDDTSVARTQQALLRAYEADQKAYEELEKLRASENPDPEAISTAEQAADDAHWAAQQAEYNKSHIDDFLSHNRINHSEEDFVLVKGNFEPIVSEKLWETCNQIRSKRAAFVKGKDGRAHKFGVSFPQNKWTKILFCDCGMRFQIEGYDKTANGGKNMRLICARSKMFKKKDAARALNGIPCPAPYASEWKLELMAREVFRTVWKENAEDILGLLRMLDANLNTTGTPNDGNQLENKLSALNEELDDLVSQRASRSITMDDFLSRSTEINNEIINVESLLQSSIQEQRPKARLDMHSIEAALSDDASFPDGKIEPGFLDRYANRIVKSNNRYIWMLQLMNVQQIMPIQSERQPIAMVTYKSGVPYDIEQEQIGKQDKESAGLDCATICRPQDFFLNMGRTTRKRKLVEWLESCQENQVSVLDEKIPLLSFAVDFVTAYEYQKARGIKIHPGLWKDMRVDIFLVKKEN